MGAALGRLFVRARLRRGRLSCVCSGRPAAEQSCRGTRGGWAFRCPGSSPGSWKPLTLHREEQDTRKTNFAEGSLQLSLTGVGCTEGKGVCECASAQRLKPGEMAISDGAKSA